MFQKLLLTLSASLLALTVACRAVGPEAERKLGITAAELCMKNKAAEDPNNALKNAKSFEYVHKVTVKGHDILGRISTKEHTEVVRYKAPYCLSMYQIYGLNQVARTISNLRGVWTVNLTGHEKALTGSQKEAMEFMLNELNPKIDDDMLWSKIVLEESDRNPEEWYKLVFYPKYSIFRSRTEYIDKKTFLPRLMITDFGAGNSTTSEFVEYTTLANGVLTASLVRTASSGSSEVQVRQLLNIAINNLNPDCICDFEYDTPLGTSHPGCPACGPKPKPRKLYDYTY